MARYTNSIAILSSNGSYEKALKKRYYELMRQLDQERNVNESFSQYINNSLIPVNKDYSHSDILKDYGKGRISSGLKSLDVLSILSSGVSSKDLFLFDNTIYAGSVHEFREADDEELIKLVLLNLGMYSFMSSLRKDYFDACLHIGKSTRNGTLDSKQYRGFFLKESRDAVKRYLGIQ